MNTWRAEGHSRFKLNRPFIADLKSHDFVALVAFTEDQVCAPKLIREFRAVCREMVPTFAARIPGIENSRFDADFTFRSAWSIRMPPPSILKCQSFPSPNRR
jgi:hypothetical protein